jgi:hypothetical protein
VHEFAERPDVHGADGGTEPRQHRDQGRVGTFEAEAESSARTWKSSVGKYANSVMAE